MVHGLSQFLTDCQKADKDLPFLLEQLPVPLMLCRGWQIVYFNPVCREAIPGIQLASLIGRNILEFIGEKERLFIERHQDRLHDGRIHSFRLLIRTESVVLDLSTVSRYVRVDETGYLIIALQDHSRLSAREKNLFQLVLETFPLNGRELYRKMMSAIARYFGVDAAALIEYTHDKNGEPIALMLAGTLDGEEHPTNYYELKGSMAEKLLEQGVLIVEKDLTRLEPDNHFIQLHQFQAFIGLHLKSDDKDLALYVVSRNPIYDTTGIAFVLNICGIRLVSEYSSQQARVRAEQQERDNRLVIEQAADPMFVLDASGQILLANNRAVDLTQRQKHALRSFFDLIVDEHKPFFRSFFQKTYGVLNHSNVVLQRSDGTKVYCDVTGVILSDGRIQLNVRDNTEKLLAEMSLKQSEEKYRSIFDNASDAIFLSDLHTGRILDCNRSFVRLTGNSRDVILRGTHFDLIVEKERPRYRKVFEYVIRTRRLERHPLRFRINVAGHAGHYTPIEIALTLLRRDDHLLVVGIIRDLTASYQAIEEHKKYLQTLSILQVVMVELDESLHIRFINNPIPKFGAGNRRDLHGMFFPEVVHEDFQWYVQVMLEELLRTRKTMTIRFPKISGETGLDWYEGEFVIVRERGSRSRIRGLIKDVTFEYIVEKQTYFMSNTDMLTSLPNRNRLEEDLFRALLRADRSGKKLAVGFVDLDRFYDVNDLLGHRLGDLAIAVFAERLRGFRQIGHMLYRWGGDQFVFVMEGLDDTSSVRALLNEIRDCAREPLTIEDHRLHVTCTVGVSMYPDDAQTIDGLFGEADRALQHGKRQGRFQFLLAGDVVRRTGIADRMSIRNRLSHAVNHGLVEPYLQPIYDTKTDSVAGMEALARLPDVEGAPWLGPDVFIPVAEDLGIIEELSDTIMTEAIEFQKRLRCSGFDLRLSVNLSRRVLYSDNLIQYFESLLEKTGADARNICLEITETLAMLDIKNAADRLHELKKLGFKVAIDDFGTGYSTLGQLYELPVDELKIDKLFVRRLHTHDGQRIAEAIVSMARALQLEIVAEGVEDLSTVNQLKDMGVRYLQGYLFSSPLSRSDFQAWLNEGFKTPV